MKKSKAMGEAVKKAEGLGHKMSPFTPYGDREYSYCVNSSARPVSLKPQRSRIFGTFEDYCRYGHGFNIPMITARKYYKNLLKAVREILEIAVEENRARILGGLTI